MSQSPAPISSQGPVVLLVEDEGAVRSLARRILQHARYEVLEAARGDEALGVWRENAHRIDVLLSDVRLPGLGGVDVAAQIRADRPEIPVVLMSGYSRGTDTSAVSAAEPPWLEKPFTSEELLDLLGRALRRAPYVPAEAHTPPHTPGAVEYAYTLDADDRITAFNGAWADFAVTNGAPSLPETVVGTHLWRHIADETTRHLYAILFRHARDRAREVRVPFRCDSPTQVREMELAITPVGERRLQMTVRLLRHRQRPYVPLLDVGVPRTGDFVRMCGWCKRIAVDESWRELEEAMQISGLLCEASLPAISHGICHACETQVHAVLDAESATVAPPASKPSV